MIDVEFKDNFYYFDRLPKNIQEALRYAPYDYNSMAIYQYVADIFQTHKGRHIDIWLNKLIEAINTQNFAEFI